MGEISNQHKNDYWGDLASKMTVDDDKTFQNGDLLGDLRNTKWIFTNFKPQSWDPIIFFPHINDIQADV